MSTGIIHGWRRMAMAVAVGLVAVGCARDEAGSCDAVFDEAAVVGVLDEQRAAWNRGDLDGFLVGYERSDRLLFTSGANIRRGFDETRDKYRARYGQAPETMGQLRFEILDVRPLGSCADAAVVLGRYEVTETAVAGEGVFSVILERHGDRWEIVHDHTSAKNS